MRNKRPGWNRDSLGLLYGGLDVRSITLHPDLVIFPGLQKNELALGEVAKIQLPETAVVVVWRRHDSARDGTRSASSWLSTFVVRGLSDNPKIIRELPPVHRAKRRTGAESEA